MLTDASVMPFVGTAKPDKARAFYGESLCLTLLADEPFALVFRTGNGTLLVSKVENCMPAPYTVRGWRVLDIDAEIDSLSARGIAFERFDGLPQDARGTMNFGDGTRVAWFRDPDGNLLSLTQAA